MNINENFLLFKLFNTICGNKNVENLAEDIKIAFSDYYELSEINILYFDETVSKLKNVIKNFEPAEDYYSTEKVDILNKIFDELSKKKYIINDDINMPEDAADTDSVIAKTISFALEYESKIIGLVRYKFKNKFELASDDIKLFQIFNYNLSLKIMNNILAKRIDINTAFYKSMKDIAKIIETQYDFQYIIPLIGEMIDKFVINHLIYIFIKDDGNRYNLYWPSACWNKGVYELLEKASPQNPILISDDRKTGCFSLLSEGEIMGCIVAHSTIDKLTYEEISYLTELSNQSSITIERANTYSEMLENATLDALTGLNNRRQFELRLKEQYAVSNRQNSPLCAIMIDIDYFKRINDTYGHASGDIVLKTAAKIIKEQLREYDIPSRYGGEEFCILLPQTSIEEAVSVAERLRSAIENSSIILNDNQTINITISLGIADLDVKDMPEDLYMKADSALYKAKELGRNKAIIYKK